MLATEHSLLELRLKARMFQDSVGFLCRTMGDQALGLSRLCKDDETMAKATEQYSITCKGVIGGSAYDNFCELFELKVFEPINVNLMVLNEIKARAHERDALRRKQKSAKNPSSFNQEFSMLTARLFEELAALNMHRYDVIRGIYEGLKTSQRRFFALVSSSLNESALDPLPKTRLAEPQAADSRPLAIQPEAPQEQPTKQDVLLAMPSGTRFDPDADRVKSETAPAFSRLRKELDEYDDDDVEDFAEYQRNRQRAAPAPSRANGSSKLIDELDDSEFDTV